jgi:hypothetical protein
VLEYNDLRRPINDLLAQLYHTCPDSLNRVSSSLRDLINKAEISPDILEAIRIALTTVFGTQAETIRLAMRSSAGLDLTVQNSLRERMRKSSRSVYLAMTGAFSPADGLRFSHFDVVSGRFVQKYFQIMTKKS